MTPMFDAYHSHNQLYLAQLTTVQSTVLSTYSYQVCVFVLTGYAESVCSGSHCYQQVVIGHFEVGDVACCPLALHTLTVHHYNTV